MRSALRVHSKNSLDSVVGVGPMCMWVYLNHVEGSIDDLESLSSEERWHEAIEAAFDLMSNLRYFWQAADGSAPGKRVCQRLVANHPGLDQDLRALMRCVTSLKDTEEQKEVVQALQTRLRELVDTARESLGGMTIGAPIRTEAGFSEALVLAATINSYRMSKGVGAIEWTKW